MIYGDNPLSMNGRNIPDIMSYTQSLNLYTYCMNNPVMYADPSGEVVANIIGLVLGAGGGALLGKMVADHYGLSGWKRWATIASITVGGAALGWFAGPLIEKLAITIAAKMGIVTSATTAAITQNLIKNAGNLNYSKTVLGHAAERAYTFSTQTIRMIMEAGTAVKDAVLNNGLKWVVEGMYNDAKGVWELVIDTETNTIVHFLFKSVK